MSGALPPAADRLLPLRATHLAAGARMMSFAGWEMPLQYTGIIAEHEAVRSSAGVFDVSHMGRVWVSGQEAGRLIRSVTTFDVTTIVQGDTHYSLYCNDDAGIDDDIIVARVDSERWLIVHNAANALAGEQRIRAVAGDGAEPANDTVMLAVQGPDALRAVARATGHDFSSLGVRACTEVQWRGAGLFVSRTGYTGEDGVEIVAPAASGADLWDALVAADVLPAGLGARETLRLEAALPLHGHDITSTTTPYEAGLAWAVTLDDAASFTGREALARLALEEPRRRRIHIKLLERAVPRDGYPVLDATGNAIGALTSGAYSPTLRAGIGMGYVPPEFAAPGTSLSVQVRDRMVAAEVVRRPFYRRPKSESG